MQKLLKALSLATLFGVSACGPGLCIENVHCEALLKSRKSLLSIVITPASGTIPFGGSQQMTATGYYSDGTTADLTSSVVWSLSSGSGTMSISATGLVTTTFGSVDLSSVSATSPSGVVAATPSSAVPASGVTSIKVGAGLIADGTPASNGILVSGSVALDPSGNMYIAEGGTNRIRMVPVASGSYFGQSMNAGSIYTIAGTGVAGNTGDGTAAISATLNGPGAIAVDTLSNVYFIDGSNNRLRMVVASSGTYLGQGMTAGNIYAIAGTGAAGSTGDTGAATAATLQNPDDLAVDATGNVFIADTSNGKIRMVSAATTSYLGQSMNAGDIYTIAGTGGAGSSANGVAATTEQIYPRGVGVDSLGNVYIADSSANKVRMVAVVAGTYFGQSMTAGDIYTVVGSGAAGYSGDGNPATAASINPAQVAVDHLGNLYVGDNINSNLRMVPANSGSYFNQSMTANDIYTLVPSITPTHLAVDTAGNAYASTNTAVQLVSAEAGTLFGQTLVVGGAYYVAGLALGSGTGVATAATSFSAVGIAADSSENLYFADPSNFYIWMVPASTGTFFGQNMSGGHLYAIAGTGTQGTTGDTGPASVAKVYHPAGVAVDATGNVFMVDSSKNKVRMIVAKTGSYFGQNLTGGDIYTIAGAGGTGSTGDTGPATIAKLWSPNGIATDTQGNVYIADLVNNKIRMVAEVAGTYFGQTMVSGDIYTIAGTGASGSTGDGGAATLALLKSPVAVATDGRGNVYIADNGNREIRMVAANAGTYFGQNMAAGYIYTIAGTGATSSTGDGGIATSATFLSPNSIAVDSTGGVSIADYGANTVRFIAPTTGTFFNQSMVAGYIYTVAGGTSTGAGNYGAYAYGTSVPFTQPFGLATDAAGNVYVSDTSSGLISELYK